MYDRNDYRLHSGAAAYSYSVKRGSRFKRHMVYDNPHITLEKTVKEV
jgi:hypothetical protein